MQLYDLNLIEVDLARAKSLVSDTRVESEALSAAIEAVNTANRALVSLNSFGVSSPGFYHASSVDFLLDPMHYSAKKISASGWQHGVLLGNVLTLGEIATTPTVTIEHDDGESHVMVGLVRADIDPTAFPSAAYSVAGFGHRLYLYSGGLYSGAEPGGFNWGQDSRAGEYSAKIPAGTGVSVRLLRNGDVHFIVGGIDKGVAGKVPVGGDSRYRLLVEVHDRGTRVSVSV